MSDLRTRIAAVLRSALLEIEYSRAETSADGEQWVFIDGMVMPDDLADAVIAELGLTQQYLVDGIISDGEPRPWEVPCETRYATEWERFDV